MPSAVTLKKLSLPIPTVDEAWVADMCRAFGAHCEAPRCALPAESVFLHEIVAALVCEMHLAQAEAAPNPTAIWLRKALADGLMLHSFEIANRESGGALLRRLRQRDLELVKQKELLAGRKKDEARELRKLVRESGIKVGAPDDALLVARQRQDLRSRMGEPIRGVPRRELQPVRPVQHPKRSDDDDGLFPVRPIL